MKKNSSFKEKLKVLKEIWQIPRYKALIKLSFYALMFILLFSFARIYSTNSANNKDITEKQSENLNQNSLTDILKETNIDNINLNYKILINNMNYNIDGEIKNNTLTGYIENNNIIKKLILKNGVFYTINSNQEIYDEELNNYIESYFLIPQNIINLVQDKKAYIVKNNNESSYTYNINYNNIQYDITLKTNLKNITSLIIKNNALEYNIIFDN